MDTVIAVSSTCFSTDKLDELFCLLNRYEIGAVELSGNLTYIKFENLIALLREKIFEREIYIHNYFPTPKKSFVLNLGHPETNKRSLNFCKKSIDLCAYMGINLYSIHAGLAFDPEASDLGKKQTNYKAISFEDSQKLLIESLIHLVDYAQQKGVRLLIENNEVAKFNCTNGLNTRYHFTGSTDSTWLYPLFEQYNLGVLLDVGHLKVCAKTFGFDPKKFIDRLKDYIVAVHLSENNGTSDQNFPIMKDSWFWPYIPWQGIEYASLEIKPHSVKELKQQIMITQNSIERYL